jgi:predicted GNAT family acetyltransferase
MDEVTPVTVTHDESSQRFVCVIEGHECLLEYELRGTVIDAFRTFVHPALRGRGLAEKLTVALVDHARKAGRSVIPSCSYTARFFQQHPEHRDVLDGAADLENGGSCRVR